MPTQDCIGRKKKIALAKLLPGRMVLIIIAQIFKARAHNLPHCVCVYVCVCGGRVKWNSETKREMEKKRIYKYNKILLNRCFHVQKKREYLRLRCGLFFFLLLLLPSNWHLVFVVTIVTGAKRRFIDLWANAGRKGRGERSAVIDWWLALTFGYS